MATQISPRFIISSSTTLALSPTLSEMITTNSNMEFPFVFDHILVDRSTTVASIVEGNCTRFWFGGWPQWFKPLAGTCTQHSGVLCLRPIWEIKAITFIHKPNPKANFSADWVYYCQIVGSKSCISFPIYMGERRMRCLRGTLGTTE